MGTQAWSDQEWIRRIKQNDPEALEVLWHALFNSSKYLVGKYQCEEDTGRDAAVSSYSIIITRGVEQFKFQSSFKTYCQTILSNEMLRLLGVIARRAPDGQSLDDPDNPIGDEKLPAEELDELKAGLSVVRARLEDCLNKLTPRQRTAITKYYLEKMAPQELCKLLNVSPGNLQKILWDARKKLGTCLKAKGFHSSDDVLGP